MDEPYYPEICPKCGCMVLYVSAFRDGYVMWLSIFCAECHYHWREKVRLDL
jgi:hypothetical protein